MSSIWSTYPPEANELDRLCTAALPPSPGDVLVVRISRRAHQQRLQQALRERLSAQAPTLRVAELSVDSQAPDPLDTVQSGLARSAPQLALITGLAEPLSAGARESPKAVERFQAASQFLLSWPAESTCRLLLWVQEPTLLYLAEQLTERFERRARVFAFCEPDPEGQRLVRQLVAGGGTLGAEVREAVLRYIQQPVFDCDHELADQLSQELVSSQRLREDELGQPYRRVLWQYLASRRQVSEVALLALARSARRVGDPDAALPWIERVAHSAAHHSNHRGVIRAELELGELQLELGKLPAAFDQYRFALRLARQHVEPQFVAPAALGLRTCIARQAAETGSCDGLAAPIPRSPYETPAQLPATSTPAAAQALIAAVLPTDWELDEFCLIYFPGLIAHIELEAGHDERIRQLVEREGEGAVLRVLASAEPLRVGGERRRLEAGRRG